MSLPFDRGLGDGRVVGAHGYWFNVMLDHLESAIRRTRDFLYESGQNPVTIADNYDAEEENTA